MLTEYFEKSKKQKTKEPKKIKNWKGMPKSKTKSKWQSQNSIRVPHQNNKKIASKKIQ
jgi:hypothetical protein